MDIETLLEKLPNHLSRDDRELIKRAYELAEAAHEGQTRASGEPYVQHCLAVAQILAELGMDGPTIAAGLLHDTVEDSAISVEDLRQDFGDEVAKLVNGVTKLEEIGKLSHLGRRELEDKEAENLRKMFLAMVDDVRVVLIKLADRLHNMRTLGALPPERQRRFARETLEIFAPLANRLGIWRIKWELEDLGFRYLAPSKYKEIAALIDERRADRERYIARIVEILQRKLREEGIKAEVTGRPKHIYSIYKKMERKGLPFEKIYDVRGVRIIVDTVKDCYAALGIVHSLWRPIPGEFDDFIATPKDNMYQSLHTSVVTDDGKTLEVQIRTQDMHRTAELGIAAHWRYKEGTKYDPVFEAKIAWLRSLMEWRQEVTDAQEFVNALKSDVFQDRVYTFTPKGDIVDLPVGSTPIDFAYHIHTEIGHRCRGAKVNDRIVPLNYQLKNGDRVEILTSKRGGPSRDWLNPHLGYVKTSRARQKIRQWFKRLDRAQNIAQGREIVERELRQLSVEGWGCERVAKLFKFDDVDDFLAKVGYGDINAQQIAIKVLEAEREEREKEEEGEKAELAPPVLSAEGVSVKGVGNLLTRLARCCNPLPGDEIIGYITRGRGVTIHRKDCPNALYLMEKDKDRIIEVAWGPAPRTYPVMIRVRSYDRIGLMRDINAIVAEENINISGGSITTHRKDHTATIIFTLDIVSAAQLSRVLAKIEQLPNVFEVKRVLG
ncbi:MAG TPA: GTP diphosphokinase [Chloroflexi bacterium]|nr:GTP diphosphokinase [Chloroflexota bacterium]